MGPHCTVCGAVIDPEGQSVSLLIVNEAGSGGKIHRRFDHLCALHTEGVRHYLGTLGNALRDGERGLSE